MSVKDTGLGRPFKNLTPVTISENEMQSYEFIMPKTHRRLLDIKGYFLAMYKINSQCLGRYKAYS